MVTEQSGNCQLAGRELPSATVLAASENLTARARQLRAAGAGGGMDELRALAYLEAHGALDYAAPGAVLAVPAPGAGPAGRAAGTATMIPAGRARGPGADPAAAAGAAHGTRGPAAPTPPGAARRRPGRSPAGFAARVNLTIPLATLLGLAERPGMLSRTGPADPNPEANT